MNLTPELIVENELVTKGELPAETWAGQQGTLGKVIWLGHIGGPGGTPAMLSAATEIELSLLTT